MKKYTILLFTILLCSVVKISAQQSQGTITGVLKGENFSNMKILLEEISNRTIIQTTTADSLGNFTFYNVPFSTYNINITSDTTTLTFKEVTVSSSVPLKVEITLPRVFKTENVTVTAEKPGNLGSHTIYTDEKIRQFPAPSDARRIESVLLNTPGVVPDEDGRMHIRGEDAQLQYVIDGIPVTENLTRVYSSLLNANIIKTIDVQTGGLNAEYGVATAGVLSIATKSGLDRSTSAYAAYSLGSYGLNEQNVAIGGNVNENIGLFFAYGKMNSDRYLDPISGFEPIHSYGQNETYFGKADFIITQDFTATALGMFNRTSFEIPNLTRASRQNQYQDLRDYMAGARLNYAVNDHSLISLLGFLRSAKSELFSNGMTSLKDSTQYPRAVFENDKYFMAGKRENDRQGAQLEFSTRQNWFGTQHEFKSGAGWERYPISEYFTFAVTNPNVSNPDSLGDARFQPYDLTRGGRPFLVDQSRDGSRYSAYIQDQFSFKNLTVNAGIRYDNFNLFENEMGVSPRLNLAYSLTDDITLRASYNRIFMQAPVENILVSSSDEAKALTGAEQEQIPTRVRSEKAHAFELGGAYRMNEFWDFDLVGYTKLIDDFIVKVELSNGGVIFPANLKNGIVAGGEFKARMNKWNNFSAQFTFSTIASLGLIPEDGSSPVSAGLILGEEGENYKNPFKGEEFFPTEHNQLFTATANIVYTHPSSLFFAINGRFDSGLPFDLKASNGQGLTEEESIAELKRRGYTDDVIDMLSLAPEEPGSPDKSVAPHAVFDLSAGYDLRELFNIGIRLSATVLNVFDTKYLYKFESSFGRTHYGLPQSFVLKAELGY